MTHQSFRPYPNAPLPHIWHLLSTTQERFQTFETAAQADSSAAQVAKLEATLAAAQAAAQAAQQQMAPGLVAPYKAADAALL